MLALINAAFPQTSRCPDSLSIVPAVPAAGEGERQHRTRVLPLVGSVGEVWVSVVHSLLMSLKHKSGNYVSGREKWGHSCGQLSWFPRAF